MPRSDSVEYGFLTAQGYALKFELFRVFLPRPDSSYRGHGKPYTRGCKGSRLVVEGGPHGVTWTHADEVNPELVDFPG
jgi:hypothetical protein